MDLRKGGVEADQARLSIQDRLVTMVVREDNKDREAPDNEAKVLLMWGNTTEKAVQS
jgi:hypothetical protein